MRHTLSVFFLGISFILNSQSVVTNLHLGTGLSQPLFEYASYSLDDGCFAQSGFLGAVSLSSLYNNRWGLQMQLGLQLHPVAVERLGYEKVQTDPFLTDLTIRSEPYRIMSFIGGPVYRMGVVEKIDVDMRLNAGLFVSYSPYQLYKPVYYMGGPPFYEITNSQSRSFAYGAGISISYAVSDCFYLTVETDFMRSEARFGFVSASGIREDIRQLSLLNAYITLRIHLPEIYLD
ncbi:MAG: hypothetical protein WCR58_08175 [Bacteroidales bacterium]|jgi:hypothetical protein|nr:hypothetical protein [Bacteroidales bacterium]MDD3702093.1 hypothetical protein [Bacteroidales bacterium]MDY0369620.1 hypothetical protein [Bacteroidales bacterium]